VCCFNLTGNSQVVEEKIQQWKELADTGLDLSWLTSWLTNFGWLKQVFIASLFSIFMIVISCCTIQCLPLCADWLKSVLKIKLPSNKIFTVQKENNPFVERIEQTGMGI